MTAAHSLSKVIGSDDPRSVDSWREHFHQTSRRLFLIMAAYTVGLSILAWVMVGLVGVSFRVGQALLVALFVFAAVKRSSRVDEFVTWLHLAGLVFSLTFGFAYRPGPLMPIP